MNFPPLNSITTVLHLSASGLVIRPYQPCSDGSPHDTEEHAIWGNLRMGVPPQLGESALLAVVMQMAHAMPGSEPC